MIMWLKLLGLIFEVIIAFTRMFLFSFSDSNSHNAKLWIKGLSGRRSWPVASLHLRPFPYPQTSPCFPFSSFLSTCFQHYILCFLPPQHTCRPRSGTCLCLWGPLFFSSFTCGLCKSGSSNSSRPSTTSFPSTLNTTCTTSKLYRTTSRAQGCTTLGCFPRGVHPDPPDTGCRPHRCWSRTWREESKRWIHLRSAIIRTYNGCFHCCRF